MLNLLKDKYKTHGKKMFLFLGAYLLVKWTLIIFFGSYLFEYIQKLIG